MSVEPAASIEQELYAKRQKIYPREVHGIFARLRVTAVLTLLGLYYIVPWLRWDERQAVLFDLPARKFYVFGLVFWPQDFFYLSGLLIIAALSLFFFTALAGRLWCGYACPQTVWTEVFMWMERLVEGEWSKQKKLDEAPWTTHKFLVKTLKHTVWIAFSLWTGFTFVGYFTPILELGAKLLAFNAGPWETFWVFFYGFATYGNAGWLREQVCIYMCPYARFQSAMFDKNTLIISYDENRGEPRGRRKRGSDAKAQGLGDCINCTICVQVCPTGIDIRDGLQYQCIGCAACIDACDDVMDRMNYPRGLIRYTTENALQGQGAHVLRPRVIIYGSILILLLAAVVYGIATRNPVGLDVIRDRNALFRETNEGLIENIYTLKVLNKSDRDLTFTIAADGLPGVRVLTERPSVAVPAGAVIDVPARLQVDFADVKARSSSVNFIVQAIEDERMRTAEPARFLGPGERSR